MAPSFAPMIGLAASLSYPLGTTIQPPAAYVSSTAVLTSTRPLVTGMHSSLVSWVAMPPVQPATAPAPMVVDGAAMVTHPGDHGVDTSDIYHNKTDDSLLAKSSCPTPSRTHPWAQSYGGGCK